MALSSFVESLLPPKIVKSRKNLIHLTLQQFKVIDLGVSGKPICDFLLVINCNFSRICYRFRSIYA